MINNHNNQSILEFGKGDICINSGYYINDDNKRINTITFSNQSPREIGSEGDITTTGEHNIEDFPVIMTFSKKESIDVLIKTLLDVRKMIE